MITKVGQCFKKESSRVMKCTFHVLWLLALEFYVPLQWIFRETMRLFLLCLFLPITQHHYKLESRQKRLKFFHCYKQRQADEKCKWVCDEMMHLNERVDNNVKCKESMELDVWKLFKLQGSIVCVIWWQSINFRKFPIFPTISDHHILYLLMPSPLPLYSAHTA